MVVEARRADHAETLTTRLRAVSLGAGVQSRPTSHIGQMHQLQQAHCHKRWGINRGVLSGTALVSWSMKPISPPLPTMASSTFGRTLARELWCLARQVE